MPVAALKHGMVEMNMRALCLFAALSNLAMAGAFAAPATTTPATTTPAMTTLAMATDDVKLRSGPGTGYGSTTTVPQGSQVDLKECDPTGAWCAVSFGGKTGFVSGKYLDQAGTDSPAWPRSYDTPNGGEIVLYQPQISEWKDFTRLTALVAAGYRARKDAKPAFGVITFTADTVDDHDAGEVVLNNVEATQLQFSTLDRNQLSDLSLAVGKTLPTGSITLSEDRLTASLASYQQTGNVDGLKSDPPAIFVSHVPAILVQTDGEAVVAPVKGDAGLSFVINTNWDIFKADADGAYFLRDEKSWLTSKDLKGEWQAATTLPEVLALLPEDENWKDARAAVPAAPFGQEGAPRVFYSDTPAELIQFQGEPKLEPVPGTRLEWASNSDGEVFFHKASRLWYVLLSGRWFSSKTLDGPWVFATPNLPDDFQNIPDDVPYASARASVPGTSENAEARLKASMPQMARVATDGSVKMDVAYSGEPKFEPIAGTSLAYAVNTNDVVIRVDTKYFVLKDGVWFVGDTPTGPFAVATAVPDQIYKIPPSSPVYNATYVRVYRSEPGAVWYGYTMGYLGAYLAWDAIVYGTGWAYAPYWDRGWVGPGYWPYYPRPASYGIGAFYNPVRGTFGRYGYAYGPYRGIAAGAAYNPRTGTYFRGAAVAGPVGGRGFVSAYNPRTNTAAIARGGSNVYGSWKSAGVQHGSQWARAGGGSLAGGGEAARWRTSAGNQGFIAKGGGGDIYAGRDGNVYRRDNGQWQKHSSDGWSPVQKPLTDNARQIGKQAAANHPALANQTRNNPKASQAIRRHASNTARPRAPEHLDFDRGGRLRGNQRVLAGHAEFHPQARGSFNRGGGFAGRGGFHGGGPHRFHR